MNNRDRNHSFYLSRKWKYKREVIMKRYNYEDQEQRRYGRVVTATMIHHIYPLDTYPMLALESWNLLPLSQASHNRMHDRLSDEIVGPGIYWQQKRKKDFEKFFATKKIIPPTSKI
ncbi:HNH endonuclease [Lacticaseibacillus brantae]|uniref:HNH endonuclease n=1 Tax=Lacticaseibacillus brantae TaxID=943673 RepID=UPI00071045C0|nr:HNH endonuclease [Lacticaseibacillus brantae]